LALVLRYGKNIYIKIMIYLSRDNFEGGERGAKMDKMFCQAINKQIVNEERTIVSYASRPVLHRDRKIINHDAWDLNAFRKNPGCALFAYRLGKSPARQGIGGLKTLPSWLRNPNSTSCRGLGRNFHAPNGRGEAHPLSHPRPLFS
jgi:hypothetical protein